MKDSTRPAKPNGIRYGINSEGYKEWLEQAGMGFGLVLSLSKPTLRNAVCLALWESRGRPIGYHELFLRLKDRDFLSPELQDETPSVLASLRVAVSDLMKILERQEGLYRLQVNRQGKEARLSLIRSSSRSRSLCDKSRIIPGELPSVLQDEELSRALVREGGTLQPASLYSNYRSAARWLSYASPLAQTKKDYEAESFFAYGFDKTVGNAPQIGIVSLAPGHGLGEVELLKRLFSSLTPKGTRTIHYLAVDSSELLLTGHVSLIREHFAEEIISGRLVFAPIHGDLFCLENQICFAREHWGVKFLSDCPILITYFGNCLGNHENEEWPFFRRVIGIFPKSSLSFLVGVSALRWKDEKEGGEPLHDIYYLDSFTLETPASLLHEKHLLVSLDSKGNPISFEKNDEFIIPFHEGNIEGVPVKPEPYATPFGVKGLVYRLRYTLKHNLATADRTASVKRGAKLILSSIIKYNLPTLAQALRERGLNVQLPPKTYRLLRQTNGPEEYCYAVMGITVRQGT